MKKVLFTVCGRAGSKGFKNKNLKVFCGQPLVYYTLSAIDLFIEQRKDLEVTVCLNTDSPELVALVLAKYPEVTVIQRPEELAGDTIAKMAVFQHSLHYMEQKNNCEYNYLIDLDITSPLRQAEDVAGTFAEKENREDLDLVFSVTHARRTPYMNMAKVAGDHVERVIDHHFTARQQTPPVFDLNASIYVFERKFLVENETAFLWDGKCGAYVMYDTGILDIDSEEDFFLMEVIGDYLYKNMDDFTKVQQNIRQ